MIQILRKKAYDTLRWSEQYTQADMVYIAKGGFWVAFGQATSSLLSLFLIIVIANLLPKETYGLYRYILSIAGVLNVFTLTGINRAVSQAVATGNEGSLKTSIKYQLKWNILMLLAFWVLAGYYFINDNVVMAFSFLILSILTPLSTTFNTFYAYLDGKKQFGLSSIFGITSTILYVIGMIIAILLDGGVLWMVFAYTFTTFASTLIFYLTTIKIFKPSLSASPESDQSTLKYGRELTFINFIGPIVSQIDKIILSHFWGATQLAVYSLAMAIPERVTGYIKSWTSLGFPKFSIKTPEEINTVFYKRIFQGMAVGAIATTLYILISPYLFKYLLPQYLDGLRYSQILAMGFVFAMPNRYVSLLFESQKLSRLIFIRSLVQSTMLILLYAIFGILSGISGLVIAYVLNSFISMITNIAMWKLGVRT